MVKVVFRKHERVYSIAKAMKKHLRETGGEARQSECRELCARMFGYRNFNELIASLSEEPSPPDMMVSPSQLKERAVQYLEEIQKMGFTRQEAWQLLCDLQVGTWFGLGRVLDRCPDED